MLVAGISIPLLIALAVLVSVTIIVTIWIKKRKATKNVHNHDTEFEEQDGLYYATLTRQKYPDITLNHPTDALYAVVNKNKQGEEGQMKQDKANPPIPVETKRQVALEDLYAVVDKQQKKKQNEETPPAQSNSTVDRVYYNTAAIRKEQAVEDEEIPPQIPPHMDEELYTAVEKCEKAKEQC